jgi:hypothetical protein
MSIPGNRQLEVKFMKARVIALSALFITSISTTVWAGERGRYGHGHQRHHHHHSHHSHGHGHNHGAYLVGGMVLGAVVNELSRPRAAYAKETVYVTHTDYDQPRVVREFRLDSDGRCYEVDNRGDRRVLLEVPRSACY